MKLIHKMKRRISIFMAIIMIAGMVPMSVFANPDHSDEGKYVSKGVSKYGTTYYVDAESGDDNNTGKSHSSPWKTLDKVTGTEFMPGDHILLKADSIWNNQMLYPKGSGSKMYPIVVDLYDVKGGQAAYSSDSRPIINGNGTKGIGAKETIISGAVMLYNQEFWEIHNLEVTNSEDLSNLDAYKKNGRTQRAGILAYSDNQDKIYEHIVIKDCYVHDVQSEHFQKPWDSTVKGLKAAGGIIILGHHLNPDGVIVAKKDGKSTAGYKDVLIEGNIVQRVGLEGIRTKCNADTGLSGNSFAKTFSNIVIRNNYLEDIAGDGIVLTEVFEGGVVENNVAKQPCNADYGSQNYAGIWSMYADNALFQYNEVYGIKYGYNDGEAYDIDMACYNNTYQYNYSHHNGGGFLLFMANQYNSVVRYNISANDGGGNKGFGTQGGDGIGGPYTYKEQSIFHYWNKTDNSTMPTIYNNTIYVGDGVSTALYGEGNGTDNSGVRARFYNNIICKEGEGTFKFLTNYPTNGSNPVERRLGENPEKYMKNNVIWPESIASVTSGATPEILGSSGNIFENPLLVIQQEDENRALLSAQHDSKFNLEEDDIYQYTSVEALRERASLFQLQSGSPATGKGMPMDVELEEGDFFGNSIENRLPDIGAHQISNYSYITEIDEIEEIRVSTNAGFYPALPKEIKVRLKITTGEEIAYRDEILDVTWDIISMEDLKASGEISVQGALKGFSDRVTAIVVVRGSVGAGFETWMESASKDSYIQRDNAATAYGAVQGTISSTTDYIKKVPLGKGFNNNYVLKIKNATNGLYNRRFLIGFDLSGFEAEFSEVSQASIRLHIARYDSWNGAGSDLESQLNNTRCILDVYALDDSWNENTVTWNNAPRNQEITQYNHSGGGSADNKAPNYEDVTPVAHKLYINRDIIANDHTIDIDITDYIIGLGESGDGRSEVSFMVDIPYSPDYNKDNSGFDAFSRRGAKAAYEAYAAGQLAANIVVESEVSLAPQIVFSSVSEERIEPIEVKTKVGTAPELPEEAVLTYSDGTTRGIGVEWDPIPASDYKSEGSFTVYGSSAVTNIPVVATVNVVADHIVRIEPLNTIETITGKTRNELGLASQCVAELDSGESTIIPIDSWNDSDHPYSPGADSKIYTFTASLLLPIGITNPDGVEVSQRVITHPAPREIQFVLAPESVMAGDSAEFKVRVLLSEDIEDSWSSGIEFYLLDSEGNPVTEGMEIDENGRLTTYLDTAPGNYKVRVQSDLVSTVFAEETFTVKETELTSFIIDSVQEFTPIYAIRGIEIPQLPLPSEAEITLESGQRLKRNIINWTSEPVYNSNAEGDYHFIGEIDEVSNPPLQNPNQLKVSVTVILGDAATERDKELLSEVLIEALENIEDGELDLVIPSVKETFMAAYEKAKLVFGDANATKAQVSKATRDLMRAIWLLEYKQADKTELKKWIENAESIEDPSIYTEESVHAMQESLAKAVRLMEDEELTTADQPAIDTAARELKDAIGDLRLIGEQAEVDKTKLRKWIQKAESIEDLSIYTEESVRAMQEAFEEAVRLMEDEELTPADQPAIDAAANALMNAIGCLRLNEDQRVDKTKLRKWIQKAESIEDLSIYTEESVRAMQEAFEEAVRLMEDEELTPADQPAIDAAANALMNAIGCLRLNEDQRVDKTELRKWIQKAESIEDLSIYTEESVDVMQEALAEAVRLMEDEELTPADQLVIDGAARALKSAIGALRLIEEQAEVDKAELKKWIKKAESIEDLSIYTEDSVDVMQEALAEAIRLMEDEELTTADQPVIDAAARALKNAIGCLRLIGESVGVDKAELKKWIQKAESIEDLSIYTEKSVGVMQEALAEAVRLMEDEELTTADQPAIDAAARALKNAIGSLRLIGEKPEFPKESYSGVVKKTSKPQKPSYPSSTGDSKGWKKDKNGWRFEITSGTYAKNEWKQVDGRWFFFDPTGYMATGWRKLNDNNWYYFKVDGAMAAGWFYIDDFWYYLNADGSMKYGWLEWSGHWYYLGDKGTMLTETRTPDGYYVNKEGLWIR